MSLITSIPKNKASYKIIDYVFWVLFILFTNPGGILEVLGLKDKASTGIDIKDFLFVILAMCYAYSLFIKRKEVDNQFNRILKYLIIFLVYYFIVFGYIVPQLRGYTEETFLFVAIKSRFVIYSISLFIMVYEFINRSLYLFFKFYIFSSIIILSLFIFSFLTGIEILPIVTMERGFIDANRLFLVSYGLMPFLTPLGIITIVFNVKLPYKKFIILAFILMFVVWLLSLTRRHIFGTFLYFTIALIIYNYTNKGIFPIGKILKVLLFSVVMLFVVSGVFPKYYESGKKAIEQTLYVMEHGKTTQGKSDARLGAGKKIMQDLIKNNYVWGTGFDNKWRTLDGDKKGYEASDYPFLGAIAMFGIVGILFFTPIYIFLIKALKFDYQFLKNYNKNYKSLEVLLLISFILYFTYDLLQYINWYQPVSMASKYDWYVYLAIYLAMRKLFYNKYKLTNKQQNIT